jgi:hypothetical protein
LIDSKEYFLRKWKNNSIVFESISSETIESIVKHSSGLIDNNRWTIEYVKAFIKHRFGTCLSIAMAFELSGTALKVNIIGFYHRIVSRDAQQPNLFTRVEDLISLSIKVPALSATKAPQPAGIKAHFQPRWTKEMGERTFHTIIFN